MRKLRLSTLSKVTRLETTQLGFKPRTPGLRTYLENSLHCVNSCSGLVTTGALLVVSNDWSVNTSAYQALTSKMCGVRFSANSSATWPLSVLTTSPDVGTIMIITVCWGNWGTERLGDLPEVTMLESVGAPTQGLISKLLPRSLGYNVTPSPLKIFITWCSLSSILSQCNTE